MNNSLVKNKGFTLIEIIVALGLFSVVLLIAISALMGVLDANRKSQEIKTTVNNINFAMNTIARDIRFAIPQSGVAIFSQTSTNNITFRSAASSLATNKATVTYRLVSGHVEKVVDLAGVITTSQITSDQVSITKLEFIISNNEAFDPTLPAQKKPLVVIHVQGKTLGTKNVTEFNLQTAVSERI